MYCDIDPKRNIREHIAIGNDGVTYIKLQETRLIRTGEFKGKYILAAIDGTSSEKWRKDDGSNSHTFKFYQDFGTSSDAKKYFHGPNDKYDGGDARDIMNDVLAFLDTQLGHHSPVIMTASGTIVNFENYIRVCLVGHSRGGLIAIEVAKRLRMPVYFMGLYDAVDRTWDLDGAEISNTRVTYHAIRDSSVGSRGIFGNDGLSVKGGILETKYFLTSHGGIGGDVVADINAGDKSCSIDARYYTDDTGRMHNFHTKTAVDAHNSSYGKGLQSIGASYRNQIIADQLTHPLCQKGSEEADEWIRAGARLYDLPIL